MKTKFKKLLMVLPLALSAISISSCGVAVTEEEGTKPPVNGGVIPTHTITFVVNGVTYEIPVFDQQKVSGQLIGENIPIPDGVPIPTKESDAYYDYKFDGWSQDLGKIVTDDMTVEPVFKSIDRYYDVRFFNYDGTLLDEISVKAGDDAVYPGKDLPTREPSGDNVYLFDGRDKDLNNVLSDLDVTATYKETLRTYKINYYVDDTRVWGKEVEAGQPLGSYNGVPPYKEPDISADGRTQTTYVFDRWSVDEDTIVTQDLNVHAIFDAMENQQSDSSIIGDKIEESSDGKTIEYEGIEYNIVRFSTSEYGDLYIGYSREENMFLIYTHNNMQPLSTPDGLNRDVYADVKTYVPFKFKDIAHAKGETVFKFADGMGTIRVTFNLNSSGPNVLQPTGILAVNPPENLNSYVNQCESYVKDNIITEYNHRFRNFLIDQGMPEEFNMWN